MSKIIEGYFTLLKILITACLAVMVVLVFGNVVLRYGFNFGITVSEELSRLLFVWLTFLGAIIVLREHAHLGMDIVVRRLPTVGKKACFVLSHILMLYATWLFLEGSWQQTQINLNVSAPATGLSMGLFYGVGVVFSISAGLILLNNLYRVFAGKASEAELLMIRESEEDLEMEELMREDRHAHPISATATPKK